MILIQLVNLRTVLQSAFHTIFCGSDHPNIQHKKSTAGEGSVQQNRTSFDPDRKSHQTCAKQSAKKPQHFCLTRFFPTFFSCVHIFTHIYTVSPRCMHMFFHADVSASYSFIRYFLHISHALPLFLLMHPCTRVQCRGLWLRSLKHLQSYCPMLAERKFDSCETRKNSVHQSIAEKRFASQHRHTIDAWSSCTVKRERNGESTAAMQRLLVACEPHSHGDPQMSDTRQPGAHACTHACTHAHTDRNALTNACERTNLLNHLQSHGPSNIGRTHTHTHTHTYARATQKYMRACTNTRIQAC